MYADYRISDVLVKSIYPSNRVMTPTGLAKGFTRTALDVSKKRLT